MKGSLASAENAGRIQHIDALRGFTMLLVVFHHVSVFGILGDGTDVVVGRICQLFRMPLFFFISGFINHKTTTVFNVCSTIKLSYKKIVVQLIPTLFWGLLYTYAVKDCSWRDFCLHTTKYGYWFTISLLEMMLLYYIIRLISNYVRRVIPSMSEIYPLLLLLTAAIMFATKSVFYPGMPLDSAGRIFCLSETFKYFHYFALGILASTYRVRFYRCLNNKYFIAIPILLFLAFMVVEYDDISLRVLRTLCELLVRYSGLIIVFVFFDRYKSWFADSTAIGSFLQFIGKRTLDIYLIHYFLIPNVLFLGDFFRDYSNVVLELFVGLSLSLGVVAVSLIISYVIRLSPVLGTILLGIKSKNPNV